MSGGGISRLFVEMYRVAVLDAGCLKWLGKDMNHTTLLEGWKCPQGHVRLDPENIHGHPFKL